MPPPEQDSLPAEDPKQARRRRDARAAWLFVAVILLPPALLGLKYAVETFTAPAEPIPSFSQIGGPPREARPPLGQAAARPGEAVDSLRLVRGEAGNPAARGGTGPRFEKAQASPPAPPEPEAPLPAETASPRWPKLKSTAGWKPLGYGSLWKGGEERKGGEENSRQVFYAGQEGEPPSQPQEQAPKPSPEPREQPQAAAATPQEAVPAPPAPGRKSSARSKSSRTGAAAPVVFSGAMPHASRAAPSPPAEAARLEDVPQPAGPPPALSGAAQTVDPGPLIIRNPPDTLPNPNPEAPRTRDAPCPKRGWWKNSHTGLCYFTRASCEAADARQGTCSQPNP